MTSAAGGEAVLVVEGIVAGYGEAEVLRGASVRVAAGEVVTVLGPNGAGKSTLLKVILGLLPPQEGTITLRGASLRGLPTHEVVRRGVAMVPQVQNVFPNLTVRENLAMGAFARPKDAADRARAWVEELFPLLRERAGEKCGRLSGGQRQMVALGRALMSGPEVLLLDEPSAGLAPGLQDAVFQQVRALAEQGMPILLVEQNARKALAVSDRGVVLDMGRVAAEGPGAELLASPDLGRLYLGGTQ